MFSRLATFRSKEAAAQKGKKLDHERFTSQNHSTEDDNSVNGLYCSLKSMPSFISTPEASFDVPTLQCSNASCTSSPLSHRNSTLESIKSISSDVSQENLTSSSLQWEEIIFSPLVLPPYEEAEEQFLEDYESYFLHLAVDNVRKDQYPMLDMREFIYLDYATCPLYSRFQLYGSLDVKYRGSILSFNIIDSTGNIFPARPVQQLALRSNIVLGCCSLIDAKNAKLLHLKSYWRMENGHLDLSLCNLEVLRLSLGPVSTFSDAYRLVMFISRFRDEKYMSSIAASYAEEIENEC